MPTLRICLLIWLCAGLVDTYQVLKMLSPRVQAARTGDYQQRLATWGPIYGFAVGCDARVTPRARVLLVDPTGRVVGGREYGVAPDVDMFDLTHFAYALYPRAVMPLGHVPARWNPSTTATDYVALWEQVGYRSPATRAATRGAQSALRR